MAGATGRITTVIARIRPGAMREDQLHPVVGAMAFVTLQAGDEMTAGFAGSSGAVVATGA